MEKNVFKGEFADAAVLSSGALSSIQTGIELIISDFPFYITTIVSINSGNKYETKITDSSINYARIPLLTIRKSP